MSDYRKAEGVSASDLRNMQRSAAYARLRPFKSTPAQEWGTAVHTAVLEPHTLDDRYRVDPEKPGVGGYPSGWRNTTEYKTAKAALLAEPGVEGLIAGTEWGDLLKIAQNVRENEIGAMLHDLEGTRESSLFAIDEEFGCTRKCRPDWLIPSARMIVDVKTAQDWRPRGFARAAYNYGYHMIAAYYIDTFGLYEAVEVEHYVFLVVASDAPYEVASYTLDRDSIEQGRKEYRIALREWARCSKSDEWPGGSAKIEEIRIPDFAIDYYKEDEF